MADTKWVVVVLMPLPGGDPDNEKDWGVVTVGPFDDEMDAQLFPMQHLDQSGRPFRKMISKLLDPTKM